MTKITIKGEISPGAGNTITMCLVAGGSILGGKCLAIGLENGKFGPTPVDSVLHLCDGFGGDWMEEAQLWDIVQILEGEDGGSRVQFWTKGGSVEEKEVCFFDVTGLHITTIGKSPCHWIPNSK